MRPNNERGATLFPIVLGLLAVPALALAISITIDDTFWKGLASVITTTGVTATVIIGALNNRRIGKIETKAQEAIRKVEVVDTKVSTTNNRNIGTLMEDAETRIIQDRVAEGKDLTPIELSHMRTVEEQEDVVARPASHAVRPPRPKIPDAPDMRRPPDQTP